MRLLINDAIKIINLYKYAAGKNAYRENITMVKFVKSGDKTHAQATDGHLLAILELEGDYEVETDKPMQYSADTCKRLEFEYKNTNKKSMAMEFLEFSPYLFNVNYENFKVTKQSLDWTMKEFKDTHAFSLDAELLWRCAKILGGNTTQVRLDIPQDHNKPMRVTRSSVNGECTLMPMRL